MSSTPLVSTTQSIRRIGILLSDLGKVNVTALKFLILQLNKQQSTFEYEFLPVPFEDQFIRILSNQALVLWDSLDASAFLTRYKRYLHEENEQFDLKDSLIDHFILVTTARFHGNFIAVEYTDSNLVILAYGDWKHNLAPPSLLEFILSGVVSASVYPLSPSVRESVHLATKGCLFDFSSALAEARLHVLTGFICKDCRSAFQADGLDRLADELDHILEKGWLGKSTEPDTPAGIIAKLGADLFVTTGLKPTTWEVFKSTLQQEWVKTLLAIIGTIIGSLLLTILLLRLGLKQ